MKKIKLLKLTLLMSIILFTACSSKQEKIKKLSLSPSVSIYNIMGITEPKNEIVHFTQIKNQTVRYQDAITVNQPNFNEHIIDSAPYITPRPSNVIAEPYITPEPYNVVAEPYITPEPYNVVAEPYISPDIEFISYKRSPKIEAYSSHKNNHNDLLNRIEWKAKSFLGTPYVWGATGPSTFDCSGFTQWVYRDLGINIPRVSRDQAKVGEYVRYENLQRGDMVFFDTKKHRSGKVTHVGIYLGNNNFIHASSAGKKVVIYNFNKKQFYKKRFLWGRRVTNQNRHYASN